MKQVTKIVSNASALTFDDTDEVLFEHLYIKKESTTVIVKDIHRNQLYECLYSRLTAPVEADNDDLFTWFKNNT